MRVLTGRQMQEADRAAIDRIGIPSLALMENAGACAARVVREEAARLGEARVLVLCGAGNNGGDGMVLARLLLQEGRPVTTVLLAPEEKCSPDCSVNLRRLRDAGGVVATLGEAGAWEARGADLLAQHDLVVDAIFGTGFQPPVRGWLARVVAEVAASPLRVVSVDLPSGLSADSHRVEGPAVRADRTVALGALKRCHVLPPAADLCGAVEVADIGIPPAAFGEDEGDLLYMTAEWAREAALPLRRDPDGHKGRYGHVLVVAGSVGKSGAAVLCGVAALRGGAGLVTVAVPRSVWPIVAASRAELMVEPLPEEPAGRIGPASIPRLLELLAGKDVLAIGPGLSDEPAAADAARAILLAAEVPRVVDADGLRALAGVEPAAFHGDRIPLLLTPHPGEMARLLGRPLREIQDDRLAAATAAAARFAAVTALKGRRTIVASPDGTAWICPTGNPGMASAGTGDVLTGIAAALLGQGLHPGDALALAVHLHGTAGDLAAQELGPLPMTAGDLLDRLPPAFRAVLPGEGQPGDG